MVSVKNFNWDKAEQELGYKSGNVINIGWYCSDRICLLGNSSKTALHYEDFNGKVLDFSFNDLRLYSNTIGTFLRNAGVKNGDRVCLFMDRIPELYFSFISILKIGAVAQPLFSAFGDESLFVRLEDAQTRFVITQRKHLPKVRKIAGRLSHLELIIIVDHVKDKPLETGEISFSLEDSVPVENMEIYPTLAESRSVLHYTSGTTGQPKGVEHVHYSLISQYITTKWVLDLRDDDIYWCTADPGWVTGTSYGIIGPWSMGVTQCILDSGFSAQAWCNFVVKNKITVWYTSPTAIRAMMKADDEIFKQSDLSCLRHLASVGEPLNAQAVVWSEAILGKPFHDTYWQTETGSIMISNFPGMKIKPGSMGKPYPAIKTALLDMKTYQPVESGIGLIAFKPGWPSMMRGYWNDKVKYDEKFKNGWYISGDRATIDNDGYYWFIGRDDDVINTGGHLVSPFEVESILLEHKAVAESAVIAMPDDLKMEVVKAFISLKPGFLPDSDLELEIMNFIRKKLSPFAMPQKIEFLEKLPKTRSGKILRRLLHAKEWGIDPGDISGIEND